MFGFCKSFNRHYIIDTELRAEDIKRDEIERPPSRSLQTTKTGKGFEKETFLHYWPQGTMENSMEVTLKTNHRATI